MFGKYQLKVGVEKTQKQKGEERANTDQEVPATPDYPEIVRATAEALGQQVILVMAVYMALDTLRKVIIKTAKAG